MRQNGIYKIINIINGKFYIGSAFKVGGIHKRWLKHKNDLNKNRHHSRHLQSAWNKYGGENFKFEILEIVENKDVILEREQYYLDTLMPWDINIGYNICKIAGNTLGVKATEETRKKQSDMKRGKCGGENNGFYNKKHTDESLKLITLSSTGRKKSEETKLKMSGENSPNGILTNQQANEIRNKFVNEKLKTKELAKIYNVKRDVIYNIIVNKTYKSNSYKPFKIKYSGENGRSSKLTNLQANEIRNLYKNTKTSAVKLGKEFNVSSSTILNIINNKTYKI